MDEKVLEEIGKEMVRKCGYLPLIISVLGGLLSERKSIEEWVLVNENMSMLYRGENEIHEVLRLSYQDLPFYLKSCFLFMGQFREDEHIWCGPDLLRMWIALGMISHEHGGKDETLFDIARAYFSELDSRCFVQMPFWESLFKETYVICQLHDAVRELCLSEGKKEGCNFLGINYQGGENNLLNELLSGNKARHLTIHFQGEITSNPDGLTTHREDTRKYVRSLQFRNSEKSEKIEFQHNTLLLEKFKLLRALVFTNFRFKGRPLKEIGNLIHLRYLLLKSCELDELPSSIRKLKYLQTLDLNTCRNVKVPNVLKELHRLKYLFLPLYDHEWVARNKYHLTLEGLDELEILANFNSLAHDWKSVITMKNLNIMAAEVYDNETLSGLINAATNLTNLRRFFLEIKTGCHLESIEEGSMILKSVFSCQPLVELTINVPIKKLQLEECVTEISTSRLPLLILKDCEIDDDPIQILAKLPFLADLRFLGRAFVGEELKCHASGIPRLKTIMLDGLPNLREWTVEQGAMPLLSSIEIFNCPRLEKIPDGLRFTRNLQQLTIKGMPELGKRVEAEVGEDFDKVSHVARIDVK